MKAISLWQPWASLVVDGRKTIETRHWRCPESLIGRSLAIHAAKRCVSSMCQECGYNAEAIPRGAVLGIVTVDKCEMFTKEFHRQMAFDPEGAYGDFSPGRYGWWLTLVEKFAKPYPQRGGQGIFNWEMLDAFKTEMEFRLR